MRRKCIFNITFRIYLLSTQYYYFTQNMYCLLDNNFSQVPIRKNVVGDVLSIFIKIRMTICINNTRHINFYIYITKLENVIGFFLLTWFNIFHKTALSFLHCWFDCHDQSDTLTGSSIPSYYHYYPRPPSIIIITFSPDHP